MRRKLQTFVSSTFQDMKPERQAAVEAILAGGHIPAGMELFAAGDASQWKIIREWIDESDVFLLILGGRYGSIEPESGLSYIELEYRYAVEVGIPVVAIVLSEQAIYQKASVDPTFKEQAHLDKWQSFRSHVQNRMVEFVDDPKDVKLAIFRAFRRLERRHDLVGWVRGEPESRESKSATAFSSDSGRSIRFHDSGLAATQDYSWHIISRTDIPFCLVSWEVIVTGEQPIVYNVRRSLRSDIVVAEANPEKDDGWYDVVRETTLQAGQCDERPWDLHANAIALGYKSTKKVPSEVTVTLIGS